MKNEITNSNTTVDPVVIVDTVIKGYESLSKVGASDYQKIEDELDKDREMYQKQYDNATTLEERREASDRIKEIRKEKREVAKQKDDAVIKKICAIVGSSTVIYVAHYTVQSMINHKKSA